MRVSILTVAFAAAVCAGGSALADAPLGIALNLGFPSPIQMFAGGDPEPARTQDVTAEYELTNLTNLAVTLKADSDCAAHSWTVTDASGTVVDQSDACPAGGTPVTQLVDEGKPADGQSIVSLHVFDYKEGQTYTLHYKAFGAEGTGTFAVTLLK